MTYRLAVALSVLSLATPAFAAAVPASEPDGSILREGHDLEWSQPETVTHEHATDQKAFQEWMRTQYGQWKEQWREPEGIEQFAMKNRQIRRLLTRLHREAVRTEDWSIRPLLSVGTSVRVQTPEVVRVIQRKSARLIRAESEQLRQEKTDR